MFGRHVIKATNNRADSSLLLPYSQIIGRLTRPIASTASACATDATMYVMEKIRSLTDA